MTAEEMVAHAKDLEPVSPAALRVISLLDQAFADNGEIVEIVKHDTVLTAKLLRACNSPHYCLEEPIATIDQAIFMLGYQEILRIVLRVAFGSTMRVALPAYAVEGDELWLHAVATATASEVIMEHTACVQVESAVAFTSGLLHDIGKLVVGQHLKAEGGERIRKLVEDDGKTRTEAEKLVLGADHAEAGEILLRTWRVPEEIIEGVAHHHEPVLTPHPKVSAVTHTANCIAHLVGSAPGWESYALRAGGDVAAALGISADKLEKMLITVQERVDAVCRAITLV